MARKRSSDRPFDRLMAKARRVNVQRDEIDRKAGFASPSQCPLDVEVRTVLCALEAGMNRDDWSCVAEAYDMLEKLVERLPRTQPKPGDFPVILARSKSDGE
jgi:hypothetical protein